MGLPKLIFTTAGSDSSTPTWGDNQYGEVKSSKSPRVGKFGTDDAVPAALRGQYQLDSYDVQRIQYTETVFSHDSEQSPPWSATGSALNTWYGNFSGTGSNKWEGTNTNSGHNWTTGNPVPTAAGGTGLVSGVRTNLGTFPLQGGGFEQMEFDTGAGSSAVGSQHTGAGTAHNYIAFVNMGDGYNTTTTYTGTYNPAPGGGATHGVTTAYDPTPPYANLEFDVSWASSALQAGAGAFGMTAGSTVSAVNNNGNWYAHTIAVYDPGTAPSPSGPGDPSVAYFSPFYGAADGTGVRTGTSSTTISISSPATTPGDGSPGSSPTTSLTPFYAFSDPVGEGGITVTMVPEIWTPGRSAVSSSAAATAHQGAVEFKIIPDTEHTMSANMVTTTATVSSMTVTAHAGGGPIATHSRVSVTTSAAHNMTDSQNQVVIAGGENVTHVNGLWNVATASGSTFTYDIPYSVLSGTTMTITGTLSCVTFDGIDKTGAVVKSGGSAVAEVVHGGNAGNNKVILRGDVSLSGTHTIHSSGTSPAIATVSFTGERTYKSLFHEAGLYLNETTGQVTSNGSFDGINYTKGLKELDGYFPKYKNGRDYALNGVKTDGRITQGPIKEGAPNDHVILYDSTDLPPVSTTFFKQLTYANGFSANISYATGNTSFAVQHETEIELGIANTGILAAIDANTGDPVISVGSREYIQEAVPTDYTSITYDVTTFPTPNTSSHWANIRAQALRIIDPDDTSDIPAILTYVSTTEMFNTSVHFTIRAMKKTSHSPTGSSTKTISGWGTYENGADNFVDGKVYIRVYNNTDADRDSILTVYADANNADSTSSDFNRNASAKKVDDVEVGNLDFLQNNYSNGNFTIIDSI